MINTTTNQTTIIIKAIRAESIIGEAIELSLKVLLRNAG